MSDNKTPEVERDHSAVAALRYAVLAGFITPTEDQAMILRLQDESYRLKEINAELLAALLSAQDLILNRWGYPADSSGRDSSLSQIESAIAKATGGA